MLKSLSNFLKAISNFLFALVFLAAVISVSERMIWMQKSWRYPTLLTAATPIHANTLETLREECGEPLETRKFDQNQAIIRCGLWWPMREVWIVPHEYIEPIWNHLGT